MIVKIFFAEETTLCCLTTHLHYYYFFRNIKCIKKKTEANITGLKLFRITWYYIENVPQLTIINTLTTRWTVLSDLKI